jgi:two-component system, response regulator FlrC
LVGPTGSGKEVLARVLHESSTRAKAPFVALNCAALPEHLIEDLLFGHDKGAFTGAMKEHKGLFEQAQGGTIFLDEIGEMPMTLQSKLLRVLQERTLTRLGAQAPIALNVRVIAATNKDLRVAMQAREFREDLYFRISTFRLSLLPLAERPGDILPLVAQMLVTHGQPGLAYNLDEQAQSQLLNYPWPGNVRELENVVQRAVVLCANGLITAQHLLFDDYQNDSALHAAVLQPHGLPAASSHMGEALAPSVPASTVNTANTANTAGANGANGAFGAPMSTAAPAPSSMPADLQDAMKQSEHQVIAAALQNTDSRMAAAKVLGISPRTLRYKLAQLRERGVSLAGASL